MGRLDSPLRDRMVFLVGAQRSGTNWLQRMLAAHPAVVMLPSETHLFTDGMDALAERVQHGVLGSPATGNIYMDRDDFLDAARDFCDRMFAGVADRLDPRACRVVERSPNHVERLGLIGEIFPDAWILHIVRDGRDVARSLRSQPWGPTSIEEAAQVWARSVRSARTAAPALARYCEVQYETLLADPADGMRKVFEWLEVGVSTDDLARVVAEAGVSFNTDANRPDVGSAKWVGTWTRADLLAFDRVAGDVLRELGYPRATATAEGSPVPARRNPRAARLRRSRGQAAEEGRPRLPLEAQQRAVDALCSALAGGQTAAVAELFADRAAVRVIDSGEGELTVSGREADPLAALKQADPAPWGRQVRGEVHVGGASTTVVLTNAVDGRMTDRVMIVAFDGAARITAVTVYRFGRDQTS